MEYCSWSILSCLREIQHSISMWQKCQTERCQKISFRHTLKLIRKNLVSQQRQQQSLSAVLFKSVPDEVLNWLSQNQFIILIIFHLNYKQVHQFTMAAICSANKNIYIKMLLHQICFSANSSCNFQITGAENLNCGIIWHSCILHDMFDITAND